MQIMSEISTLVESLQLQGILQEGVVVKDHIPPTPNLNAEIRTAVSLRRTVLLSDCDHLSFTQPPPPSLRRVAGLGTFKVQTTSESEEKIKTRANTNYQKSRISEISSSKLNRNAVKKYLSAYLGALVAAPWRP